MVLPRICVTALVVLLALASASAEAATRAKDGKTKENKTKLAKAKGATKKSAKNGTKNGTKNKPAKRLSARAAAAKAKAEARAKAEAEAIAAGKAAVFVFDGDETEPVRKQVVRLLKANGMQVQTDLRPNDTAEQFRDMAAALNLAIYVHGRIKDTPRGRSLATITIRSGVTGRKIASANFEGDRRELVAMIEEGLWDKVRAPLGRTCVDAQKPRRHNAPMRIEAGTPIEDSPRRSDGS